MKHTFICALILFWMNESNAIAQPITSKPKTIRIDNTPELFIENIILIDENNSKEVEAGEMCSIQFVIRNNGTGSAKSINVDALLDTPPVKGFRFSNSIYIGNMLAGKADTFELKLFPQISMENGFVRLKLEALESNGFNAKPEYVRLNLHSKGKVPGIGWMTPWEKSTTVYESQILVNCCVVSDVPVRSVNIFMNGEVYADRNDMKIVESVDCDYEFEASLKLREGVNRVYVELDNGTQLIKSETRVVTFEKVQLENRLALVIGNGSYGLSPLKNPPNDARDIAATLRVMKFDVIELINGNKLQMRDSLRKFKDTLADKKGVGLFYYAGHGVQLNDQNFLIPVNLDIKKEEDIEDEAMQLKTVLTYMQNSGTRMNIVILDACRDNPFTVKGGLADIYAEGGSSLIAFATKPGAVAEDGEGKNGLYTQELLKAMKTAGLEIITVFQAVSANVKRISNDKQIPWTTGYIGENFYFTK